MLVDDLATWVLEFGSEGLPPDVEAQAKLLLLDSLACAAAAQDEETCRAVIEVVEQLGGTPECTIIGTTLRTSAANAILANGSLIRAIDLNDIYWGPGGGGHPSDNIAVLLAMGERQGCAGREMLTALVMAYELYGSIQDQSNPANEWDHTSASAVVASAVAARLMRLNHKQTAEAIALGAAHGLSLGAIRSGQISAAKAIANSLVAHTAVLAALLAQQGLTGPRDVLEGPRGWAQTVLRSGDVEAIVPDTTRYRLLDVSVKAYPCIGTGQSAVAATLALRDELGGGVHEVERIQVRMADIQAVKEQMADEDRRRPNSRETADHSFFYLMAIALLDGELTPRQFEGERWQEPLVQSLMNKFSIEADSGLKSRGASFPAVLEATLTSGATRRIEMAFAPGDPRNRFTEDQMRQRFRRYSESIWTAERRDLICDLVGRLEELSDVRQLAKALGGA